LLWQKKPGTPAHPLDSEAEAADLKQEQEIINNATGGQQVTIGQSKPSGIKLPGL